MLFSSTTFLYYFLPVLMAIYFIVPKKLKNPVLLLFSLFFYSWGEPIYLFLMVYSSLFNYIMAIDLVSSKKTSNSRRNTLIFTLIINIFILAFFKYYGFLMDSLNYILGTDIKYTALGLPIGISFYTFQALSYIIDVYRGRVQVQKSLIKFSLYLSLFPQLIAGPIVKYKDIENQLENRTITGESFGYGAGRFIIGLSKKVLLANSFGAIFTYTNNLNVGDQSVLSLWLGIIAYTLQIYFDFSGYSDMAIGLGKIFGFTFMENFNYPYVSKSITEFWRRWHISLSTWFKEYLYIPLGGNRVNPLRHAINLLIVWTLTGLWHGASWNFVFWGFYYGVILILEKYLWGKKLQNSSKYFQGFYSLVLITLGWVFFGANNLSEALHYLQGMFFLGGLSLGNIYSFYIIRTSLFLFLAGIFSATPRVYKGFEMLSKRNKYLALFILIVLLLVSTASIIYSSYNPFLYFRF